MRSSNQELVRYLIRSGVLRSSALIEAFTKVDRRDFVPPELSTLAYVDEPLPIGFGQTISQPTTVAFMFELLQLAQGQKILDVGSGSGWTTALLATVAGPSGNVFGVEKVNELIELGAANLKKYPSRATIQPSGSELGLPGQAPFDRILVSAAGETIPPALVAQLTAAGTMVLPVQGSVWQVTKTPGGKTVAKEFPGFVFVPLR